MSIRMEALRERFYMSLVIRMPACAELGIIVMDGIGQSHEMHILHAAGIDSISYVVSRKVIAFARDAEDRVVLSVIRLDFTEKLMIMLPEISNVGWRLSRSHWYRDI